MRKLTTEEFITKAKDAHGDRYDYSKVKYKTSNHKVAIICHKHGKFEQVASYHIGKYKNGCPKCAVENRRLTLDYFLQKAKKIHGDKFDYSLITEYKPSKEKVDVICKKHGPFRVSIYHHINRGQGCSKCKSLNLDGFLEKANIVHNNKYDYSKVVYTNNKEKIDIICPIHGLFNQRITDHINGQHGCLECTMETIRMSTDEFIIKANKKHENKYIYDAEKINFKTNKDKVNITCERHGVFSQKVNTHLNGAGCPSCSESKGEFSIRNYLDNKNIQFKVQKTFKECKNINMLRFDFYLPNINTCIEFNGIQHYEKVDFFGGTKGLKSTQKRDKIKESFCKKNDIQLLVIKYDEDVENVLNSLFLHL